MSDEFEDDINRGDEPLDEEGSGFGTKGLSDLFRRALMTGIGSVFMTEDMIRRTLSDMKMPKEAVAYVVSQADKTKKDLVSALARELRHFLDGLELQELISKSFENKTFEIHTTIKVIPDESGTGQKLELVKQETTMAAADKPKRRRRKESATEDD